MKESIYTIPISDAFEGLAGCPFCEIRHTLERRWVEYITGAAMMEPDVRQKTNESGFCRKHFDMMLKQKNRLSVALMLQTHLDELGEKLMSKSILSGKSGIDVESCFVCEKIDTEFDRLLENTVVFWAREHDFQEMYMQQKYVCLPDCSAVLKAAKKKLRGRQLADFAGVTRELAAKRLFLLKSDIDAFCMLYDYRSAGSAPPSTEVAESIERAILFLTGE